ncbi:sugar phosphate isomerase/epimerase [bacterium]|nr:sugar phosphate isomerase/epimerase [bacterium]
MNNVYVNIAIGLIEEHIKILAQESIGIEIYIDGEVLDEYLMSRIQEIGERVSDSGLKVNVHGPYFDLNPGYTDNFIRESVIRRVKMAIDVTAALNGGTLVLHSGFRPGLSAEKYDRWLANSLKTWSKILDYSIQKGIILSIENIRDDSPGTIRRILDYFNSDYLTHCFDIGHFNVFVENMAAREWLDMFSDKISVIHLHDNDGDNDSHKPLGRGKIDFIDFFSELKKREFNKALTIENNTKEDLIESIKYFKRITK